MAHGLHQTNELLLVRRELEVTCGEGPAEIGERPLTLVKDGAEPHTGGVVVDHERPCEVWHLENGPVVRAPLRASNAAVASSSQAKASRRSRRVRGVAMRPKSRMNFR